MCVPWFPGVNVVISILCRGVMFFNFCRRRGHVLHSPQKAMFSKLCSPPSNKVMGAGNKVWRTWPSVENGEHDPSSCRS